MFRLEKKLWKDGIRFVAGVDEAGRGPLAGPVVAAAVMFGSGVRIRGVNDSKKLSREERDRLCPIIRKKALCIGVGVVSHEVIDEINILQATMRAMREAVAALEPAPEHLLVDGHIYRNAGVPFTTIIDGDALSHSIAAASIIAKVTRDELMLAYDADFPGYGFCRHKGYGTPEHLDALRRLGPCAIHRKSFHWSNTPPPEAPGLFAEI